MHIILGANGHVGSALAHALLDRGEPVTVVSHEPDHAGRWSHTGARVAVVDVRDVDALRAVFRRGTRAFLLNPPAAPDADTVAVEKETMRAIVAAVDGSGLEKVVAESTYGAQPGDGIGDLGVLYEMEQRLTALPIAVSVIRAAYYMSNWDASLDTARQEGTVHTLYPPDFRLPMVAPHDLGQAAARLITEPVDRTGVHYVEGPSTYSSADVAAAFAAALGRPVQAVETPRDQWIPSLRTMGFSAAAATSFANMTALTLDNGSEKPNTSEHGSTSLTDYIQALVTKR